jgi:hypothetical protein
VSGTSAGKVWVDHGVNRVKCKVFHLGMISSASPQLGAAKREKRTRGCTGGVYPNPGPPPAGTHGGSLAGQANAVNERQSQAQRNREAICD